MTHWVKSLIRYFLLPYSEFFISSASRLNPFINLSFSQEGEDRVLMRYLGTRNSGYYVDIGAHHPYRFSNTKIFYKMGWRGINIEPSPPAFKLFLRDRKRDINLNIGISETTGLLDYYVFDEPALNTFDINLVNSRLKETSYRVIDKKKIPVDRLDNVLNKYLSKGQDIDFFSIDVEGLDLEVLRSNNWDLFRPKMVLVEALDLNGKDIFCDLQSQPIDIFMREKKYCFVAKTFNTIFYLDSLINH